MYIVWFHDLAEFGIEHDVIKKRIGVFFSTEAGELTSNGNVIRTKKREVLAIFGDEPAQKWDSTIFNHHSKSIVYTPKTIQFWN